jgi:cell wall-associated NlpC family hydrolase
MRTATIIAVTALLAIAGVNGQGAPSILTAAEQWEGTPYLYGGAGDPNNMGPSGAGIDCSHLVWRAITESVDANFQYLDTSGWAASTPAGFQAEDCSSANNGDLVLFQGHIGVSSGSGQVYSATSHGVRNGQISWFGTPINCFTWVGGGSSSGGDIEEPPKKSIRA